MNSKRLPCRFAPRNDIMKVRLQKQKYIPAENLKRPPRRAELRRTMENIAFDCHKRYSFYSIEDADGLILEEGHVDHAR